MDDMTDVPAREHELWGSLDEAARVLEGMTLGPVPSPLQEKLVGVVLDSVRGAAQELSESQAFREQAAALGQAALAEDPGTKDFERRAAGFGDGAYPTVDQAIDEERQRLVANKAFPPGWSGSELAIRALGITTYGHLYAFLRGEAAAPAQDSGREPVVVQFKNDKIVLSTAIMQAPVPYELRRSSSNVTEGVSLGMFRSRMTEWMLGEFASNAECVIAIQRIKERIAAELGRKASSDDIQRLRDWWSVLRVNGETLIIKAREGRDTNFTLNPVFKISVAPPEDH